MDYLIHSQYATASSFRELPGNDWLTHQEVFSVTFRGRTYPNLQYCHKAFAHRGGTPPPYSTFLNAFLNMNERFVRERSVAIDIGAYDGDTTLPIALLVGERGKVFAFEPGTAFVSQLGINLGLNPTLPIEAHPYAIMPEDGIHQFLYSATDDNGGAAATNSWVGTYTVPRLVRAVNLEQFLLPRLDERMTTTNDISFLKIDTEGHDFVILWGLRDMLKHARPVIHAEWFPRTDGMMDQLVRYLGYKVYCGFTLEPITLGVSPWRQDVVLVPSERTKEYDLS